jgi:hypothetical protein
MKTRFVAWMGPLVAAIFAGVLSGVLAGRRSVAQSAPPIAPPVSTNEPVSAAGPGTSGLPKAGAELALALAALAHSASAPAPADTEPPPAHPSEEDRVRGLDREAKAHAMQIEAHRTQARDMSWAPAMEEAITNTVRAYDAGVTVGHYEGVDCRSTTCVATFVWPSREQALDELRTTMERIGAVPCATGITMPPADSAGAQRYEASIYMDCQSARGSAAATNAERQRR